MTDSMELIINSFIGAGYYDDAKSRFEEIKTLLFQKGVSNLDTDKLYEAINYKLEELKKEKEFRAINTEIKTLYYELCTKYSL